MNNNPAHNSTGSNRAAFLGLRSRMALSFGALAAAMLVLVVLAATFGIPFTSDSGLYGKERSDVLKNLSLVADLKKDRFLLWLQERKNDTRALSQSRNVREQVERLREMVGGKMRSAGAGDALWIDIIGQASYQRLDRLFRMVMRTYRVYHKIQAGDAATGRVFFSTDEKDLGSRVSDQRYFAQALDSVRGASVGVERDPSSDKPFLTIARVIEDASLSRDGDRPAPAILITYIDTDHLIKPMLHTGAGLGKTGDVVLVNQEGKILADLKYPLADGTRAKTLEHKIEAKPATLAVGGKEGIVITRDYRGVPVLAAYRHIRVTPDQGWGMVVKRDRAEVFAPMRHRILIAVWIGAIGILGTIALAILISARISGPIRSLSRTAEEVKAGNLSVRSLISGSDEVGTLASTFNAMIDRVQNWHKDLEEQVKARTSALTAEIEEHARAEKAVREGEARYRSLVENMGNAVAIYTAADDGEDFVFVDFNAAGEKIEQISRDQLIGKSVLEAFPGVKEFGLFEVFQRVWKTGEPESHPVRLYKDQRIEGWRENFVYKLPAGEIVAVYSDETQRKQAEERLKKANRALMTVSGCNQALLRTKTELELIREVCRIMVEVGGYRLAWVGFAEQDEKQSVRPVASWGYEEGYLERLNITWADTERGRGPTGTAIRTGKPAPARNIQTDPAFEPWRDEAMKRGYASALALPLLLEDRLIGALNIYAPDPDAFNDEETALLLELAEDLSYGIESLRTRQERTQALEAQQESLHFLQALMDAIPNPIFYKDVDGVYSGCNQAFAEFLGLTKERIVGKSVYDLSPRDLADKYHEMDLELFRNLGVQVYESSVEQPDGTRRDVIFHKAPFFGYDGELAGLTGVILDITDRKRAEEELKESEEKYRLLFSKERDAIMVTDAESRRILDVNEACEELYGYTREELLGMGALDLSAEPEKSKAVLPDGAKPDGVLVPLRLHRKKDGTKFPVEISAGPVAWRGQQAVCSIVRDISERRRAEEDRLRLVTAIEQSAETILITDPNGTIQYVNPYFERTTGYSADEAVGQNPRILKSGKQEQAFYEELWETIVSGQTWTGHFINKKKDGTLYEEEATISPIKDESGQVVNYVAVKRDVTNEVKMEKQLRQVQKMEAIGTLAGGIAHDFNNILTAIIGYTELALSSVEPGSDLHSDLEHVHDAGARAADLVKQILAFSRRSEQEIAPIRVAPIVKEVVKFLRASLPTTIEIRQTIQPDLGAVLADPTQIHQVIMNLCTNAGHAMREKGGVLEIGLDQADLDSEFEATDPDLLPGAYLRLTIRDTGHGIPAEILERIFEPYFTTKQKGEGTGLGLAVVHGIVRNCGGSMQVSSEPGEGSTFHAYFPVVQKPVGTDLHSVEDAPTGDERILFVDDEPGIVGMAERILEGLGYRVETRTSAVEALELFRDKPGHFDLVITDMTMPKMTGKELAVELLAVQPDIPIILCTGFSEQITRERAEAMGIRAFLMKPDVGNELARTIRNVLDSKEERET